MRNPFDASTSSIGEDSGGTNKANLTLADVLHVQEMFEREVGPARPNAIKCSFASYKHLSAVLGIKDLKEKVIPSMTNFIGFHVFEDNDLPFGAYEMGYIVGGKFKQHL